MKKCTILLIFIFSWQINAQGESLFNAATEDYNAGNYEAAAKKYLEILDEGSHSAALYYNLGNCYYKLNKIAPSIYYYEKALMLTPNDPEIKSNLAFARNMTLDDIEAIPETGISKILGRVTGIMSFDQWSRTAVGFILLFVCFYITYYYLRYASRKRLAFAASMACILLSVVSVLMAYLQYTQFRSEQPAIVFAEEAGVKSEPNERSPESFKLHEGTKVQVIEALNDWQKIQLADGSTGWIQKKDVKLLKDF
jgi:tetratricopeptide (TPR) repeat protein